MQSPWRNQIGFDEECHDHEESFWQPMRTQRNYSRDRVSHQLAILTPQKPAQRLHSASRQYAVEKETSYKLKPTEFEI